MELLKAKASNFLVFSSVGKSNAIKSWLANANFDLCLVDYVQGQSDTKQFANYYLERKGGKFQNLHYVYSNWPEILSAYDVIFVADDDLFIRSEDINQ